MLENATLKLLSEKKNLLAFSAGVDSSALFFLLQQHNIKFDIAIVDYSIREQSKKEVIYAQELARKHNLTCHLYNAPQINKNFESNARKIRYNFFETIIEKFNYENLLTAHHLGDRFEWMLMQFCKGAGSAELVGMSREDKRKDYTLLRPLLNLDKQELYEYLHKNNILYFEDSSNEDDTIKRNSFRHQFTRPLLQNHLAGIKKSFEYLDKDKEDFIKEVAIHKIKRLIYFKSSQHKRSDIYAVDKELKKLGYMSSAKERELLHDSKSVVLGRKHLITFNPEYIFITPYGERKVNMPHKFKEQCRVLKIEPKLRTFLYEEEMAFLKVKELFTHSL